MNATGSSDASIVLPLLLLGLALVGAFAAGGALWLLFALGALVYLTVQLLRPPRPCRRWPRLLRPGRSPRQDRNPPASRPSKRRDAASIGAARSRPWTCWARRRSRSRAVS